MAVNPKCSDPTYHISLSDGKDKVGFILTNVSGNQDERVFRRHPNSSVANPFVPETQNDWSGGFGKKDFEDDRSGYWLSHGIDATKGGRLALGPRFRYAKGVRSA